MLKRHQDILKALVSVLNDGETDIYYDPDIPGFTNGVDVTQKRNTHTISEHPSEIFDILIELKGEGYVHSTSKNLSGAFYVRLTDKGKHYREYLRRDSIDYLKDKWEAYLAVLISLAALVVAIIK